MLPHLLMKEAELLQFRTLSLMRGEGEGALFGEKNGRSWGISIASLLPAVLERKG